MSKEKKERTEVLNGDFVKRLRPLVISMSPDETMGKVKGVLTARTVELTNDERKNLTLVLNVLIRAGITTLADFRSKTPEDISTLRTIGILRAHFLSNLLKPNVDNDFNEGDLL